MTRLLFVLAFLLGAAAIIWVGAGFMGTDSLALAVTLLIAGVFAAGFMELVHFRRANRTLTQQLNALPDTRDKLENWLADLPSALQTPVRRRIEGLTTALPGPMLSPYLSGLLVMLGLLGTFVGMIVTLQGAVTALEGGSELQAIRNALAAPIAGLSLAFGTSIAGVAASAMLGLAATLSRRDRVLVTRALDQAIRRHLYPFSRDYQRELNNQAMQTQAEAVPAMVAQLEAVTGHLEQLGNSLAGNQNRFQDSLSEQFETLARDVGHSLMTTLNDSSQQAAQSIRPVMEDTLARISEQLEASHQHLNDLSRQQLTTLSDQFQQTTEQAARHWRDGLSEHQRATDQLTDHIQQALQQHNDQFQQHSEALLSQAADQQQQLYDTSREQLDTLARDWRATTEQATSAWQQELSAQTRHSQAATDQQHRALEQQQQHFQSTTQALLAGQQDGLDALSQSLATQLAELRDQEAQRGQAATDRLAQLEGTVTEHLSQLGTALEAPMTRLIETASQTPKAAAEVITRLREEMAHNSERDNQLLEERQRLMSELDDMLSTQRDTATAQQTAIESLIRDSGHVLTEVGQTFSTQVADQADKLDAVAAEVTGGAQEVASLSDAFCLAVNRFGEANDKLVDNLQRIEGALDETGKRSDEQLAYYVAQAREVIDLSMSSQQEVIDALGALQTPNDTLNGSR